MKKRFPAFFLALALCLGLAVPAFAADEGTSPAAYTYISPASGEDYPYVNWPMEYKRRAIDDNFAYAETKDLKGTFMVAPTHEYFYVGVYGLAKGEEADVEMNVYTDHDGDGIYDMRIFQKKGDAFTVLPIPENGAYKQSDIGNFICAVDVPGFERMDDGDYAFSAAHLHEFFGDNTLIFFYLGDDFLGAAWLCAGAFDDVPGAGWYSDPVAWAAEEGIAMGTGEGEFSPGDNCTHIQILTFLSRAAGNTKAGEYDWQTEQSKVKDWARKKGMIDDSFDAQKPCNRAEAVNYIWQAKDKPNAQPSTFNDMGGYEQYAKAVDWAYEKGITKGSGNGIFDPGSVCNRAYIATFLYRAYN